MCFVLYFNLVLYLYYSIALHEALRMHVIIFSDCFVNTQCGSFFHQCASVATFWMILCQCVFILDDTVIGVSFS